MQTNTMLLTARKSWARRFDAFRPLEVSSRARIQASLPNAQRDTLWISDDQDLTSLLLKLVVRPTKRLGRAVLLFKPTPESITPLQECFDPLAFGSPSEFLPPQELAAALAAENCEELFIGGTVDHSSETVTLWRGDLQCLVVPFSAFPPSGDGTTADFGDFAVTDFGQTVRFGRYEAAADAILYEYDAEYRQRKRKARRRSERSLGASLQRLRIQRGLRQADFGRLAKTVARIERSEVRKPRPKTLAVIARRLGVEAQELASY